MENVEPLFKEPDIWGPVSTGCEVIWEGRVVPKLLAYDKGEKIDFVLDGRLGFEFPRQIAFQALAFAANAMAVGAGFPCFSADKKIEHFATPCSRIEIE